VADWDDGVSASCTVGPIVRYRGQWMAISPNALRTIGSSQSAATPDIVTKALLVTSLTHVSDAIATDLYLYL